MARLYLISWLKDDGVSGKLLFCSLMLSVVKDWKFKILFVSVISIASDSSSSDLPCVCIIEEKIWWAEQIRLSQTLPIWLIQRGFFFQVAQPPCGACICVERMSNFNMYYSAIHAGEHCSIGLLHRMSMMEPQQLYNR